MIKKRANGMIAVFLVCLMMLSLALISCNNGVKPSVTGDSSGSGSETDKDDGDLLAYLPKLNFDGQKYTIFDYNPDENAPQVAGADVGEAKESVVISAVYKRNSEIMNRYGVEIVEYSVDSNWDDRWSKLHDTIMVGENMFDLAVFRAIRGGLSLIYDNILLDMETLPYLDLENPWWNQKGNQDVAFFGKNFFANSPIDLHFYQMPWALYTNLDMIKDVQLESPTKSVLDYTWTADKMMQYCMAANKDLNGDTKMDENDRYGLSGVDYNAFPEIMAGFNVLTVTDGDDGFPVLNTSAAMVSAYEKAYDMFYGSNSSYYNNNTTWNPNAADQMQQFGSEYVMFTVGNMSLNTWAHIRAMEFDLTVLPVPMLDEAQKDYYTYTECPFFLGIPSTANVHAERTGFITEALAALSYTGVLPSYYETALKEKYTRDEDGIMKSMIDMIYKNLTVDKGIAIWDEPREVFLQALYAHNPKIVSVLATKEKLINRNLDSDMNRVFDTLYK